MLGPIRTTADRGEPLVMDRLRGAGRVAIGTIATIQPVRRQAGWDGRERL